MDIMAGGNVCDGSNSNSERENKEKKENNGSIN